MNAVTDFSETGMKNDYLWDKSGADAEIERLEQTLSVFAFEPRKFQVEPGVAPQAVRTRTSMRSWLRSLRPIVAFSVACFLLAVAVGAGLVAFVGFVADERRGEAVVAPTQPVGDVVVSHESLREESRTNPEALDDRAIVREPVRKRRPAPFRSAFTRQPRTTAERRKQSTDKLVVTDEEREAYRQLIFALSLTSSKLRLVNNAVNGVNSDSLSKSPAFR